MSFGDVELLAPAGNMESLKAAVIGGANAVYLGLKDFSARAKATNFSLDELTDAVTYAHFFGAKVYIAVNTLIKDCEMDFAEELVHEAVKRNIDAVILQDLGLLKRLREKIDIPIHASTQVGIHNMYGARAAKKLGFDRIILSRETMLEDIRAIRDNVDIEIESFVQGALCVAFSGNCLFSSLISGYSGNRGKCMQLCRKKYKIDIEGFGDEGYYLSAKDICRLPVLGELIDSGVTSFKIEGRMRRKEYVGESTAVYRKALDAIKLGKAVSLDELKERLMGVYNRGDYCVGYVKDGTESVIYPLVQGHKGIKIGTVKNVLDKRLELSTDIKLHTGDGLKFIGKHGETGGSLVSNPNVITFDGNVRSGDGVYLTTDSTKIQEIANRQKTLSISINVVMHKDLPVEMNVHVQNENIHIKTEIIPRQARSAPLNIQQIVSIFSKGYAEYFSINDVNIQADNNIFLPIGQLKELRRLAESTVVKTILEKYESNRLLHKHENDRVLSDIILHNSIDSPKVLVKCDSLELIKKLNDFKQVDGIIFVPKDYSDIKEIEHALSSSTLPIFLQTPIMARGRDLTVLESLLKSPFVKNIVAENLYAIELFENKNVLVGSGMNLINSQINTLKIAQSESDSFRKSDYVTAYSQTTLMTFAHCPYKNLRGSCKANCKGFSGTLRDEKGSAFCLTHYKVGYCYAELKNERPLYIADELKKIHHDKVIYDFCGLSPEFAERILLSDKIDIEHTHFNYNKKLK